MRVLGAILNDVSTTDSYQSYYYASYLPGYEPVPEGDDVESAGGQLLAESVSRSGST